MQSFIGCLSSPFLALSNSFSISIAQDGLGASTIGHCLSYCSVAGKGHHDQGDSFERRHLFGDLLMVLELVLVIITGSRRAWC